MTKAFIPQANLHDLKDVPQEVRDEIEIIPVSKVREVLQHTGLI